MIAISKDEYRKKFEEHLKALGENPGETFFGKWAWYAQRENEFKKKLVEEGYTVLK